MKKKKTTFFMLLLFIIMNIINKPRNVVEEKVIGKWKDRATQF